ncbi:MAG: hypothetical protein AB7K24_08050 [Gemmataceae bacterium]
MSTTLTLLGLDGLSAPELQRRIVAAAEHPDDWVAWEDALAATLKRSSG